MQVVERSNDSAEKIHQLEIEYFYKKIVRPHRIAATLAAKTLVTNDKYTREMIMTTPRLATVK